EAEPSSYRKQRKDDRDGNCSKRHGGEEPMRTAAKEFPPGADGEDDENLGRDRFDKPTGLKQGLAGAEQMQQSIKGHKIEDRADRPEHQHELLDQLDVPLHRPSDRLRID